MTEEIARQMYLDAQNNLKALHDLEKEIGVSKKNILEAINALKANALKNGWDPTTWR